MNGRILAVRLTFLRRSFNKRLNPMNESPILPGQFGLPGRLFPEFLADKIKKFEEAVKIRDEYDSVCFDGGDAGHKEQITALDNGLVKCRDY